MSQPSPEDQIVETLTNLGESWLEVDYDPREWRTDALPMSLEESTARKETLIQIQTSLLPSVKQQLNDLLRSFGLADDVPQPKLDAALEITSKFGSEIERVESAIISLAPWVIRRGRLPSSIDANDGVLKKFRSDQLMWDFRFMLYNELRGKDNDIRGLFLDYVEYITSGQLNPDHPSDSEDDSKPKLKDQIIHKTALLSRQIDDMVQCSTRSDYGVLQHEWKLYVGYISELLPQLTAGIQALNTPQAQSMSTDQPEPSSELTGLVKPLLIKLFQRSAAIIKLVRIFLNKLIDTPTRKTPIAFGDNWTSDQLVSFQCEITSICTSIEDALESLVSIPENGQVTIRDLNHMDRFASQARKHMEDGLAQLANFMIPAGSSATPPSPKVIFDDLFSDFVPQFNLSIQNFKNDIATMQTHLEKSTQLDFQGSPMVTLR
ncbi:hypothetical protein PCASD_23708 [Puccinia coronata f. sp. avenae]|uniref:Uncharacterized protein n=1 Tax=Puccinia coronata f. sp. avenae TaxID=200324 RepID=A0A2N5S5U2_9BASI|nr:hypothetical protein PCASD_23708 [Puccinia coronata f. sp. avenae]